MTLKHTDTYVKQQIKEKAKCVFWLDNEPRYTCTLKERANCLDTNVPCEKAVSFIKVDYVLALLGEREKELREIAEKHRTRREDGSISFEKLVNLPTFIEEILGEKRGEE